MQLSVRLPCKLPKIDIQYLCQTPSAEYLLTVALIDVLVSRRIRPSGIRIILACEPADLGTLTLNGTMSNLNGILIVKC